MPSFRRRPVIDSLDLELLALLADETETLILLRQVEHLQTDRSSLSVSSSDLRLLRDAAEGHFDQWAAAATQHVWARLVTLHGKMWAHEARSYAAGVVLPRVERLRSDVLATGRKWKLTVADIDELLSVEFPSASTITLPALFDQDRPQPPKVTGAAEDTSIWDRLGGTDRPTL